MGFSTKSTTEKKTNRDTSRVTDFLLKIILGGFAFFLYLLAFLVPTQLVLMAVVPFLSGYFLTASTEVAAMDVVTMYTLAGISIFAWYEMYKKLFLKLAHRLNARARRWILEGKTHKKGQETEEKVD